jgi:hypothetical protein
MTRIEAPWSAEQVAGLTAFQKCGWVHEFTCAKGHEGSRILVANQSGWTCPTCGYRQSWAWDWMTKGAPPHPLDDGALAPEREPSATGSDHESPDE